MLDSAAEIELTEQAVQCRLNVALIHRYLPHYDDVVALFQRLHDAYGRQERTAKNAYARRWFATRADHVASWLEQFAAAKGNQPIGPIRPRRGRKPRSKPPTPNLG